MTCTDALSKILKKNYEYFLRNGENKIVKFNIEIPIQRFTEPEVEPISIPHFACVNLLLFSLKFNHKIIFPDDFVIFF